MTAATEQAVYAAGIAAGASNKAMLAAFETIIVESGAKNLASRKIPESMKLPNEGVAAGDHDSLGAFQQRASWGSVASRMNVGESAARFFAKAKAKEKEKGWQTAGQLAQAVQVSAFPLKYDAVEARAQIMLARALGSGPATGGSEGVTTSPVSLSSGASSVSSFFKALTDTHTWVRVAYVVFGLILLFYGLAKMTGTVDKVVPVAKKAAKLIVLKKGVK